jgi:aryl-alcohol dehydrogenase-like predicted oxidoreductase
MKLVKLQNDKFPTIALGTWSWGTGAIGGDEVFGNYFTETDLKPVFDAAMDAGFNLWDTAAVYGMNASENILASFIKGREDVLISTKFTPQMAGDNDNAVVELLEGSLNRLSVDYVGYLLDTQPGRCGKMDTKTYPFNEKWKSETCRGLQS